MKRLYWMITGTLVAGTLDIVYAIVMASLKGVRPTSVPQAIAAGILGKEAFRGGVPTMLLGLGLHFFIIAVMAAVFYLAVRLLPVLARHIVAAGLVYGIGLYIVMTYIVLPLSNFTQGHNPPVPPVLNLALAKALFAHMILVGLTIALATRQALKQTA